MTKTEAHAILDGLKNGIQAPQYQINRALLATGDIGIHARVRGSGMDQALPGESEGSWTERSQDVVGENNRSHREIAWL